jgi:hypothetical protein
MKPLAQYFSMTSVASLCASLAAVAAPGLALCDPGGTPPSLPSDLVARADAVTAFPTFCQIPTAPSDVRGPAAFKAGVVDTRLAGARVVALSAPETFSLHDTEAFVGMAKAEAAPPPPMSPPGDEGTDAFIKNALGQAQPPGRR